MVFGRICHSEKAFATVDFGDMSSSDGSPAFAAITLLAYVFVYPIGLVLNLIGLFTGPRRGCFVMLLLFYVVLPVLVVVAVVGVGLDLPYVTEAVEWGIRWLNGWE